jgi:hypothetical protein
MRAAETRGSVRTESSAATAAVEASARPSTRALRECECRDDKCNGAANDD